MPSMSSDIGGFGEFGELINDIGKLFHTSIILTVKKISG